MSQLPHKGICCSSITLTPSLGSWNTPSSCFSGRRPTVCLRKKTNKQNPSPAAWSK